MRHILLLLLFGVCCTLTLSLAAEERGVLKGRFVFDGKLPKAKMFAGGGGEAIADERLLVDPKSHGIANVIITLYVKPGGKQPEAPLPDGMPITTLQVDERCLRPRVKVMHRKQLLTIRDVGKKNHALMASLMGNKPFTLFLKPDQEVTLSLPVNEKLPAAITDPGSPWIGGYLFVTDTFTAVSRDDGSFVITRPPLGKWTFRVWHERSGFIEKVKRDDKVVLWEKGRLTVDIHPGENDLGEILVGIEEFPEK